MGKYRPQNYERNAETQHLQKPSGYSILDSLQELAEDRGADVDPKSLAGLARKLETWPSEEVYRACQAIGRRTREEGQPAFPTVGMILDELRAQGEARRARTESEEDSRLIERWFWEHVDFKREETGWSEQQVLDSIKQPGFTGRKAGTRPDFPPLCEDCGGVGMIRIQRGGNNFARPCHCRA